MEFNFKVEVLLQRVERLIEKDLQGKRQYNKDVEIFNSKVKSFNIERLKEYNELIASSLRLLDEVGEDKIVEDLTEDTVWHYNKDTFWGLVNKSFTGKTLDTSYQKTEYMKGLMCCKKSDLRYGYILSRVLKMCEYTTKKLDRGTDNVYEHPVSFAIYLEEPLFEAKKLYQKPIIEDEVLLSLKRKLQEVNDIGGEMVTLDNTDLALLVDKRYEQPDKCPRFEDVYS